MKSALTHTRILLVAAFLSMLSLAGYGQKTESTVRSTITTKISDNTVRAITPQSFRETFNAVMDIAVTRIPFVSSSVFQAGGADTARFVAIQNSVNKRFFNYVYTGDTTASTSDKDGLVDGDRVKRVGKRLYQIYDVVVTPEQFGAVGDGVVDDYNALNNAITYLEKLPNKNGGVLLLTAPKYELALKKLVVDSLNIHVVSHAMSVLENGTLSYRGKSFAQPFNSIISGIRFEYGSFTHGDSLQGRNGIEIANVNGMRIINCTFNNTNYAIKLVPTGYRQAIKRMVINQCHVLNSNYGIIMPPISDANYAAVPQIGTNKSRRTGGDIKILNFTANSCDYASISIAQCDGLQISDALMFSPDMLDATGRATKTHNIKLVNCTYTDIINSQLFESGLEGLWIEESDNIKASGLQVAWSGQRIVASGVRVVRKTEVPVNEDGSTDVRNRTLSISIVNSFIENPTLHGIFLDGGAYSSRDYRFTDISLSGLGSKEKYFGDTTLAPKFYDHYSILADASFRGVIYTGTSDSYYAKQRPKILGSGYYKEFNTFGPFYSEEYVGVPFNTGLAVDEPKNLIENLFPQANNFGSGVFTRTALTAAIDSVIGPQGEKRTAYKLTESGSGNIQHIIYTNTGTGVSLSKVAGDTVPFTFSGYFKPIGRKFFTLIANNSVNSSGIVADFDLEAGASTYAIGGGNNKLFQGHPKVLKAGNGWYKIIMTFTPDAAYGGIRFGMIPKENIQDVGSRTYTSDGRAMFYVCDWQLSKTTSELPFTNTTGTQQQKQLINFGGGSSTAYLSAISGGAGVGEIVYENDGTGIITSYFSTEQKFPRFTENLTLSSGSINSGLWTKQTGSQVIVVNNAPVSAGGTGTAYKFAESNASNLQRGVYQTTAIAKADSAITYNYSFSAKADSIKHINVTLTDNGFTGNANVDLNLETGRVIRIPAPSSGYLIKSIRIRTTNNGYRRYSINYLSPAGETSIRTAIFLKPNAAHVGNAAYTPTGATAGTNGFYLADQLLTQSDEEWPYVATTTTAASRKAISYSGVTGGRDTTGLSTVSVDVDGLMTITPKRPATYVNMISSYIGNRLRYSSQLSSGTGWATSGATDLGVVTTSDTIGPAGPGGRVTRAFERTTTNVQRGIWNIITINNTNKEVAQKWTGSIEAKYESGGIPAVNLNFTNTSSSGSISYDIDLVNHRLIRKNAGTSGTYGTYTGNDSILVQQLPNGWYRYTATVTLPATTPNIRMRVYTKLNNTTHIGNAAYAGVIGRKVYLTRFNLEQADGHTEYAHNEGSDTTAYRPIYYDGVRTIVAGTGISSITKDALGNWTITLPQNVSPISDFQVSRLIAFITNGTVGGFDLMGPVNNPIFMRMGVGASAGAFSKRADFGLDGTTESGSNAGSRVRLRLYADDGTTLLGTPVYWNRSNLKTVFGTGVVLTGVVSATPYADNAAALLGGLVSGDVYRTSTGVLMIVY